MGPIFVIFKREFLCYLGLEKSKEMPSSSVYSVLSEYDLKKGGHWPLWKVAQYRRLLRVSSSPFIDHVLLVSISGDDEEG